MPWLCNGTFSFIIILSQNINSPSLKIEENIICIYLLFLLKIFLNIYCTGMTVGPERLDGSERSRVKLGPIFADLKSLQVKSEQLI